MDEPTEAELLAYTNAYIATSNAIGDAIIILKRLESGTFDPDEQMSIIIERRRLEDEYARNERSFHAVMEGEMAMNPPSQEEVNEIVQLASEVALLTQKKATARGVIRLATSIATRFEAIRDVE